jgi:uncharacterized membrane protein
MTGNSRRSRRYLRQIVMDQLTDRRLAQCMTSTQTFTDLSPATRWLSLATAFGSVVTGGTLFAFSSFVLPGLRRLPAADAVAAMQAINVQAPRSLLMLPLLGSAAGGMVLAVLVLTRPETPDRALLIAGALAAVATVVITGVYHVPHNDALARLHPDDPSIVSTWTDYARGWLRWNHVRTLTALGSGIALTLAVLRRS